MSDQVSARFQRARLKVNTYQEIARTHLKKPTVGIAGSYNTGNIGDLALGWTVRRVLENNNIQGMLNSSSVIERYPIPDAMIFGGGGVLPKQAAQSLRYLAEQHPHLTDRTALVGLGGWLDAETCSPAVRDFLNRVPFFSVRSERDKVDMSSVVNPDRITVQPDLVFGMSSAFRLPFDRKATEDRVLGVSVLPFFLAQKRHRFISMPDPPFWNISTRDPELASVGDQAGERFVKVIQSAVKIYKSRGWRVRVIPFTIEDETFAKVALRDVSVEFVPYDPNPLRVAQEISQCDRFISTRLHSHIFSFLVGVPTLSIGYDLKCSSLWSDLGLPAESQIQRLQMVQHPESATEKLTDSSPVVLDPGILDGLQRKAIEACQKALHSVGVS